MDIGFIVDNVNQFKELLDVFAEVFEWNNSKTNTDYIAGVLENKSFLSLAATVNNKVIGGLTAYILPDYENCKSMIYIYDLGVKTSFQKKGIGKKLIQYLIEYARENDFEEIFVDTEQYNNEDAISFYKKTPFDSEMKVLQYSYKISTTS